MKISKGWAFLALMWTGIFGVSCIVVPLFSVISLTFSEKNRALLIDPVVLVIARATLGQALLSTLISAALGLPLGLWLGRFISKNPDSRITALFTLPYGVPTVIAGMAWVSWLGRS